MQGYAGKKDIWRQRIGGRGRYGGRKNEKNVSFFVKYIYIYIHIVGRRLFCEAPLGARR